MKKLVFIVPPENFRDEDISKIEKSLDGLVEIDVVSTAVGKVIGMLGTEIEVKKSVYEIKPVDYDIFVVPSGLGTGNIEDDEKIHKLLKKAVEKGKIVCGIGSGIKILLKSGILEGKKVSFFVEKEEVKKYGGKPSDKPVEISDNIITCSDTKYIEEVIENLKKIIES